MSISSNLMAQATTESTESRVEAVIFRGQAMEYFVIWITSLALICVTLGLYSPWAKIKRIRYFRNNTEISGGSFGFHASGKQIFKGRIVLYVLMTIMSMISLINHTFAFLITLLTFALIPWAINYSLKFNAKRTSWRNIRFNWHGTYFATFLFAFIGPLIGILSLGLLTPFFSRLYFRYYISCHSLGDLRFNANPKLRDFYKAFCVVYIPAAVMGLTFLSSSLSNDRPAWHLLPYFAFVLLICWRGIYITICRNLVLRSMILGDVATFGSKLSPWRIIWITGSNYLAMIASLGLLTPWAQIRIYDYLADATLLRIVGDIDGLVDTNKEKAGVLGEEYAEMADIGFDF
ncbi:MAG: YjgN family protein [Candidatus Eutrophobiaceae bacterium]